MLVLTLISDTPSVSRIHSEICLNSPSSVMVTRFLLSSFGKFMYTLEIASIPCRVMSVSMLASMQRKNTSSSILSNCSSSCDDEKFKSIKFIVYPQTPPRCVLVRVYQAPGKIMISTNIRQNRVCGQSLEVQTLSKQVDFLFKNKTATVENFYMK